MWGIFDLGRQAFVSKSIGHSDQYIGVILHDEQREVIESWMDSSNMYHGNSYEVRIISDDEAHLMYGCICSFHRKGNQ